jgi:hypothetical protein
MSTVAMALLALSLGALVVHQRQSPPLTVQSPTEDSSPTEPNDDRRIAPNIDDNPARDELVDRGIPPSWPLATYVQLRDQVLRDGVGALAQSPSHGDAAPNESWTPRSQKRISELLEG